MERPTDHTTYASHMGLIEIAMGRRKDTINLARWHLLQVYLRSGAVSFGRQHSQQGVRPPSCAQLRSPWSNVVPKLPCTYVAKTATMRCDLMVMYQQLGASLMSIHFNSLQVAPGTTQSRHTATSQKAAQVVPQMLWWRPPLAWSSDALRFGSA